MIKSKYKLDNFQIEACNYIDKNINILVSAPTGSGKTAIAEYSIEKIKEKDPNAKIIYTCPIKSLCNEKYGDMVKQNDSKSNIEIKNQIGLMTGDIIINPNADIIIMTMEVLYNLLLTNNKLIDNKIFNPKCVIFDEVHYINDETRGHVWEKSIISCLKDYDNCLLVLLSATIGNIDSLIDWLCSINSTKIFKKVVKIDRPVPLKEWILINDEILPINNNNYNLVKKNWFKLDKEGYSIAHELEKLCTKISLSWDDNADLPIYLGIPAIFFVLSKVKCIELAEMLKSKFTSVNEELEILNFYDKNLKEFEASSQYIKLRKIIGRGIAYHHSGLIPKIREVVEFLIKNKLIKIVFATETFAVGLNFPVKTVIMTSLSKPSEYGMRNLLVSEYKQMAGRAGRRFIDLVGNVVFWFYPYGKVSKDPYPIWATIDSIINGQINSIESKYLIDPNYILKTIESNNSRIFTDNSFKYYKSNKIRKNQTIQIPDKFKKIYELELENRSFANSGMTINNRTYTKMLQKLSPSNKIEYKQFLEYEQKLSAKSDYENFIDLELSINNFLLTNQFINYLAESVNPNESTFILTDKGKIAIHFNEINPIIFTNEIEYIMKDPSNIIPILSMFIDDGDNSKSVDDVLYEEDEIKYFDYLVNTKYKEYVYIYPKWNFYPKNFQLIKEWINNPTMSLDAGANLFHIDIGLLVKILIKLSQVCDELLNNLVKINLADLAETIMLYKQNLIRYPLKIESLYIS